jgi:integrase
MSDMLPLPPMPAATDPGPEKPRRPPATAPETKRLYAGDWRAFRHWCRMQNSSALPAAPATVAAYLAAGPKLRPGTLRRRLAAIAAQHRQHGLVSPVDAVVRQQLSDARRAAPARRAPPRPSAGDLARMAATCPGDFLGKRDRALLLLLAAAGLGRAALVGLDVEHIFFSETGADLLLRPHSAGDSAGRTVRLERGPKNTCPVRALEDWLRTSETAYGPVFRKIDRWGNLEHRRLGTDALRRIFSARRFLRDVGGARTTGKKA